MKASIEASGDVVMEGDVPSMISMSPEFGLSGPNIQSIERASVSDKSCRNGGGNLQAGH